MDTEYESLRAELLEAHQPQNAHERVLVEEFVDAAWDLKAARRVDREFWEYVGGHYNTGAAGIAEAQFQEKETRFKIHLRYRANCERSYYRALAALKDIGRAIPRILAATPPAAFSAGAASTVKLAEDETFPHHSGECQVIEKGVTSVISNICASKSLEVTPVTRHPTRPFLFLQELTRT